MTNKLKFIIAFVALLVSFFALNSEVFSNDQESRYWAVTVHDHNVMSELSAYAYSYINKARVQVVELKEPFTIEMLPGNLRKHLRPFNPKSLVAYPNDFKSRSFFLEKLTANKSIEEVLKTITAKSLYERIQFITDFGPRSNQDAIDAFVEEFESMGYETKHNFNIEAWKKGKVDPSKYVIVMGHMDTVRNTVGADDNASGAAGVMEIAKALKDYDSDYSILFMLNEDEEIGLVGAEKYVQFLEKNNLKNKVLFVVNMDMIGYNKNGVVDLETEDQFEDLANWMATLTKQYTTLTPNVMLDAWASDHVPFIQANIPTLLTIEHWDTHTPCWHKACDTIDTVNMEYAAQILKLNTAATIQKAKVHLQ